MQYRSYMDQYCRTKSIHQQSRAPDSHKQILQQSSHTRTRDNSSQHLKISESGSKKPGSRVYAEVENRPVAKGGQKVVRAKMSGQGAKLVTNSSMKSVASQERIKASSKSIMASMENIGVGLTSQKKKPKLVTLAASSSIHLHSPHNTACKSQHNQSQSGTRAHNRSIVLSKSQHSSAVNSKYNTNVTHNEPEYRSVRKEEQPLEVVDLDASMFATRDAHKLDTLEAVYGRVRSVLEAHGRRQQEWEQERRGYLAKIRLLQGELAGRKGKQLKYISGGCHVSEDATFRSCSRYSPYPH